MNGKRYPEKFRIGAVKQVVERGDSVSSVATRPDLPTHSLYAWIKKYDSDASTNKERSDAHSLSHGRRHIRKAESGTINIVNGTPIHKHPAYR